MRPTLILALLVACGSDETAVQTSPPDARPTPDAPPPPPPLPVGMLVASRGSNQVLRYDGSGASAGVFAADGALVKPVGIAIGPDGDLYVAAGDTDRVMRFGADGASKGVFAHGGDPLMSPRNLTFGPDGKLYVADGFRNQIIRYDATGAFVDVFVSDHTLQGPTSFTFGPDGDLYVVSVLTNTVLHFSGTMGGLYGPFATSGLDQPHDVSFGPDGNLYVTNSGSGLVKRFHGDTGAPLDTFVNDFGLINPLGMAWGPDGNLYIANQGGGDVRRYDGTTGKRIDAFVAPGAGGLNMPSFLVFLPPSGLELARAGAALVVSGARPGAKVLFAHGSAGGHDQIDPCPALTLDLGAVTVDATRVADESGFALANLAPAAGAAYVVVDAARCAASAPVTP